MADLGSEPVKMAAASHSGPRPTAIEILGVRFDHYTLDQIVDLVLDARPASLYIVTPNVDHVVRIHRTGDSLRRVYAAAAVSLCDSRVLAALSFLLLGKRLTVVPGSDLTARLLGDPRLRRRRVFVVGGGNDAARLLRARFDLEEVESHEPPPNVLRNNQAMNVAVELAVGYQPDIVFCAIGPPQQELLASEIVRRCPTAIALCVGGSVDFLIGRQRRAPKVLQHLGLEWLYRLATNPRRLAKRYLLDDIKIVPLLVQERRRR